MGDKLVPVRIRIRRQIQNLIRILNSEFMDPDLGDKLIMDQLGPDPQHG